MPEAPPGDPPIEVRKARLSEVAGLARVLARAFHDDPVMDWVARPDDRRLAALESFFAWYVRANAIDHGEVTTTAALDACAVWEPPDAAARVLTPWQQLYLLPSMIRMASLARLPRLLRTSGLVQKAHPRTEPHFYLAFMGVLPEAQGKGLGTALLAATLARLDRAGLPAYLENSNQRNAGLYERYGFRTVHELVLAPGAPKIWCMWRAPRGA